MKKYPKKQLKEDAQDKLLAALPTAFYAIADDENIPEETKQVLYKELNNQMARIEKLFGYEPYTWGRW